MAAISDEASCRLHNGPAHLQRPPGTVRDDPAAGALDVAAGPPGHYMLRGLYGAVILGPGKIIVSRRNLKEERCRTGS
jgi:hypothetical protein